MKGYENRDMDLKLAKIKEKAAKAGKLGRNDMELLLQKALNVEDREVDQDSFDRPDSGAGDSDEDD